MCAVCAAFMLCAQAFAGNIVLKIVGVNPSKEQSQQIEIKAYLPKEILPEDVVDKDDLTLIYDPQQGAYCATGTYDLEPGATIEKQIKVKDIWVIAPEEIKSIRDEATKTVELIGDSTYKERAVFLRDSIMRRIDAIDKKQGSSSTNPQRHISEYRDNLAEYESIKADLVVLRSLLAQSKSFPVMTVWKVILMIIVFLSVLSVALYVLWTSQMRAMADSKFMTGEAADGLGKETTGNDSKDKA
jgi:hypothetical protein